MDLVYTVRTACRVGCRFCPFRGEPHRTAAEHVRRVGALLEGSPSAKRLFLFGGDLAAEPSLPILLASIAEQRSPPDVYVYTPLLHPKAVGRLLGGVVTGLIVPFFHVRSGALPLPFAPEAVLRVARGLQENGLRILPYLFVLNENIDAIDQVVRALHEGLACDELLLRVMNIRADRPRAFSYADAEPGLRRLAVVTRDLGIDARFWGNEYPPPCTGLWADAPELYSAVLPEREGPAENRILEACATCALRRRCRWDYGLYLQRIGAAEFTPVVSRERPLRHVRESASVDPEALRAVRWYYDRSDLPVRCTRPWTATEMLSFSPKTAGPCNEDWLKTRFPPLEGGTVLGAWNGRYFCTIRERLLAGADHETCHPHCAERSRSEAEPSVDDHVLVDGVADAFLRNRLLQIREILERRVVLSSRPLALTMGPTIRCNHRCVMCHNLSARRRGQAWELEASFYDQIRELLPTLADLHVSGAGEPLVSARFRAFLASLDAAQHPDLRVTLTTNGSLLDRRLLERLYRVPFRAFIVSLNAATAETHRAVSGADDFERVRANLERLLANRSKFAVGPPAVQLAYVVLRRNLDDLPAFLDLARDLGCGVRLAAMEPDDDNVDEALTADAGEMKRALAMLADLRQAWSREPRIVQYLDSVARSLALQRETNFVVHLDP